MAAFFHEELEIREHSSDLFLMNLNPFLDPTTTTTTTTATNLHNYNLCLGSQKHRPRVSILDEVDHIEQGNSPISTVSNGGVTQSLRSLAPIYLKSAQEFLNEIVNIGNYSRGAKQERKMSKNFAVYGLNNGVGDINGGLMTQELQIKKAKLISMVEKVEERYKQYHNQMQTISSSFEQAAGLGSANSYTYMALQTISKQFRSVKDIICLQIKHINKLLGEKECESVRLGKMPYQHSNAWRPQRGLPERAVSILRSWLFEHFLHPYPRDLDKEMLAKQTGLTKNQVSNWFINARVRVWKPMVEEMYLEEMNIKESTEGSNLNEHSNKGSSSKKLYDYAISNESLNSVLPAFYKRFIENEIPTQNSSSSCSVMTFKKQHVNQTNLIHFNGGFQKYHAMVGNGVSLSLGMSRSCDKNFKNIQFGSTSHEVEDSDIFSSPTYQIMN